jgi:PQQ enzyme repeat
MRIRAVAGWALLATVCMFAGACNRNAIDPNLPAITMQPVNTTAAAGSTATFTVTATGEAPLSYQWFVFAQPIKGATSTSYTTKTLAPSDNNSFYFVVVSNSIGSAESDEVLLTVTTTTTSTANTLGNANPADVLTQHNDAGRTGLHLGETLLTPSSVNAAKFGKLGTLITDGEVDAQPLYASGVALPSGDVRNILYAATEHGSVYAFDATSGSIIWQAGLNGPNEQPADSGTCTSPPQERGITATPVIDRTRGPHGAVYVIANTKDSPGTVIQRIHALDIATGSELFSGPTMIQASANAGNSVNSSTSQNFDAARYQTLAGLQLVNGKVFAAFGPNCGAAADSSWIMGFDAASLSSTGSLYLAPAAGSNAPGFTTAGLSADSTGDLYIFGQATFGYHAPGAANALAPANAGNAFLKLSTENGLALTDYSETSRSGPLSLINAQGGMSGGAVVLPDFTDDAGKVWHLALGAASDGSISLLNRDSLGGSGLQSAPIVQVIWNQTAQSGVTGTLAYFGNTAFSAVSGDAIKAFTLNDARLSVAPVNQSTNTLGASGAQISVSANATTGGILWAVDSTGTGILRAFDAADLSRALFDTTQAANSRDAFASAVSAVPPTVASGRVYVATKGGIVVFGQLK